MNERFRFGFKILLKRSFEWMICEVTELSYRKDLFILQNINKQSSTENKHLRCFEFDNWCLVEVLLAQSRFNQNIFSYKMSSLGLWGLFPVKKQHTILGTWQKVENWTRKQRTWKFVTTKLEDRRTRFKVWKPGRFKDNCSDENVLVLI